MQKTAVKKCLLGVFTLLLMLCVTSSALSQSNPFVVFGPQQFDKPKGKPITYTESFQVPESSGKYILWVESGSGGFNVVKNVSVSINGVEVIKSADLRTTNPVSGVITVQPNNTLSVTLKGKGGNFIVVYVLRDPIQITSPTDGETINAPFINVMGVLDNPSLQEIGVVVNGVPAQVAGNDFFINNMQLVEGENALTVVATDSSGSSVSEEITVYFDAANATDWIELSINPESGIAPLEARLRADHNLSFVPVSTSVLSDGPGEVIVTPVVDRENEYDLIFSVPGLYAIAYTAFNPDGSQHDQEIMVNVIDRDELDIMLKAKWDGMKTALTSMDVDDGVEFFLKNSQEQYREAFNALIDQLPQMMADMQDIEMIYARDSRVKYRINQLHDIDGTPVNITYYIYFIPDRNGIWKIEQF